jgi:hypothetical protein
MPGARRHSRFPPFRTERGKDGPPVVFVRLRFEWAWPRSWLEFLSTFVSHGQTRGPSTSHSGSLCEPEYCAQDDTVKHDTVRRETTEAAPRLSFSRVGTSISGGARPRPISEANAVRLWTFSFPIFPHRTRKDGAVGCLAWARSRGPASGKTQGPSTALGMTDCCRRRDADRNVRATRALGFILFRKRMLCARRESRFPLFRTDRGKMGTRLLRGGEIEWAGV